MAKNYYVEFHENEDLVLPSEELKRTERRRVRSSGRRKSLKWPLIIAAIVLIYMFYNTLILYLLELLKLSPTIYNSYLFIESEVQAQTLLGLFLISVLGSLFFLVLPSEALFFYYLSETAHFPLLIIALVILGSLIGLSFNYLFGRLLGERLIKKMFSKNFDKYKERIDKYGGYVLLIGNIIPGPIEVLVIFYGGFKFHYGRFIFLCLVGRIIKYLILFIIYLFFWDSLTLWFDSILTNVSVLGDLYGISDLASNETE